MEIMELGALGELVGALAVVGSLLFVGLQLRQAAATSIASAEFSITTEFNGLHRTVLANPELAALLIKVEADETLDPLEARIFRAYATHLHATWLGIQQSHTQGSISDLYFQTFKADVEATCRQYPALARMMQAGFMNAPQFRGLEIFERIPKGPLTTPEEA